jgi:LPPG:FO 2-phospho-L-lactate transferase
MSDRPVRTVLSTDAGVLPMQTYFVRRHCEPRVCDIAYAGAESAEPAPQFEAAMAQARMVVFCPSNPYLSIGPILAVPGVRKAIAEMGPPRLRVAVSPIVGGAAVGGPAGKIMAELGSEVSCVGVARRYQGICDVLVIDQQDAHRAMEIKQMGLTPLVAPTIMNTEADKIALARRILQLTGD